MIYVKSQWFTFDKHWNLSKTYNYSVAFARRKQVHILSKLEIKEESLTSTDLDPIIRARLSVVDPWRFEFESGEVECDHLVLLSHYQPVALQQWLVVTCHVTRTRTRTHIRRQLS